MQGQARGLQHSHRHYSCSISIVHNDIAQEAMLSCAPPRHLLSGKAVSFLDADPRPRVLFRESALVALQLRRRGCAAGATSSTLPNPSMSRPWQPASWWVCSTVFVLCLFDVEHVWHLEAWRQHEISFMDVRLSHAELSLRLLMQECSSWQGRDTPSDLPAALQEFACRIAFASQPRSVDSLVASEQPKAAAEPSGEAQQGTSPAAGRVASRVKTSFLRKPPAGAAGPDIGRAAELSSVSTAGPNTARSAAVKQSTPGDDSSGPRQASLSPAQPARQVRFLG